MNNCPHCNANLIGGKIPDDIKHHYHDTHWRRDIGIEHPDKYDGIWEYQCPDCKGTWPSEVQIGKKGWAKRITDIRKMALRKQK